MVDERFDVMNEYISLQGCEWVKISDGLYKASNAVIYDADEVFTPTGDYSGTLVIAEIVGCGKNDDLKVKPLYMCTSIVGDKNAHAMIGKLRDKMSIFVSGTCFYEGDNQNGISLLF